MAGEREVLSGVISPQLVIGAPVGGPYVETLESRYVESNSKRYAHESPGCFLSPSYRTSGDTNLNHTVPEKGLRQYGQLIFSVVALARKLDHANGVFAVVIGYVRLYIVGSDVLESG